MHVYRKISLTSKYLNFDVFVKRCVTPAPLPSSLWTDSECVCVALRWRTLLLYKFSHHVSNFSSRAIGIYVTLKNCNPISKEVLPQNINVNKCNKYKVCGFLSKKRHISKWMMHFPKIGNVALWARIYPVDFMHALQ